MTQVEHSKGPWKILPEEVDKPYIRVRGDRLGGRFKIANVLTPVYADVHEREAQETRANAILIAAAPDLLAALQFVMSATGEQLTSAFEAAQDAISKATGGQS